MAAGGGAGAGERVVRPDWGVWHYPEAATDHDWATVTFHSAGEHEIVDELWEGP